MLLFQKRFFAGLQSGAITLTFRRWEKPHVKPKGRYRVHPIGIVQVDALSIVDEKDLTDEDARKSGFADLAELRGYLIVKDAPLYKVTLHHAGDGDRVDLADEDDLDAEAVREIRKRLARLDKPAPWTRRTMKLIAANPRVAASKLAKKLKRETLPFKVDVRKLKKLGLTMSFEVGYELSPRGRKFMKLTGRK